MNNNRTRGFWFLLTTGILLVIFTIIGQTMSFINYAFAVSIRMQEPKEVVTEMGVAVNKGFGVGDTVIYIPLLLIGLAGLWLKKSWGIYALAGAFAITAYWPIVTMFMLIFARGTPGFKFRNFTSYSIILTSFVLYGLWGLWYLQKNRKTLVDD